MHLPQKGSFLYFFSCLKVAIFQSESLIRKPLVPVFTSMVVHTHTHSPVFVEGGRRSNYILWILSATTTGFSLRILAAASAL